MFDDYGVDYDKRQTVGIAAEPTFKVIYRGLFASRRSTYDHENPSAYNNYDVDKHRSRFDLPENPREKR